MNDFTKIKLINSLIDVVERFYELKNSGDMQDAKHLKGFCEGLAFSLIELEYLSQEETSQILKGLGKKRKLANKETEPEQIYKPSANSEDLDIPTYLRHKKRD